VPDGVAMRQLFRKPSWRVELAPLRAAGTSYLDSLSANTRQQIRRSIRLYERRGPLTATRARDAHEALAFLDELKILHQRYWTGRGEPGGFAYPFFERFQRRLIATSLADGALELVRIACGPAAIGYVYNLVHAGRVMAYQTGIDYEDDAKLKPGLVSHALCIQMHLDEGAEVYDFMAGAARYKASMATRGPDMVYCVLERPTLPLRLEQALRGLRRRLRRRPA
jgi:CelD/BcsL family acetyltransferase involved in cellulose biosynthesis